MHEEQIFITPAVINQRLRRNIRSGDGYTAFMPFSDCSSKRMLGYGDTSFAIDNMAKTAQEYQHQTQALTQHFFSRYPLGDPLKKAINDFLYWHIQYSIDGDAQLLRSPACSWASRYEGVDCKSYSIFASCILLNLGISHYMRRIVQKQTPHGYSHVYVVVPYDQKTYNLDKGYFHIDATLTSVAPEIDFLHKDDVFVKAKKTSGLAAPAVSAVSALWQKNAESPKKRQAWTDFVHSIDAIAQMNPENSDLHRLKQKIQRLINQGKTDLSIKIEGFSVWIEGEQFNLWNKPVQGLGNAQISQALDDLIHQGHHNATAYVEQARAAGKQKVLTVVNTVGGTAAAVSNVVPGIGQIIAVCLSGVTALVSLAVMFGYDPCASRFYRTDYIGEKLGKAFLPAFKRTIGSIEKHLLGGTEPLATADLNKLLQEIDLGYAHYHNELKIVTDECNKGVLLGYIDFVKGIKDLVTNTLNGIIAALSVHFNISVIEKEALTSARTWYFIVPSSRNTINARYRFLNIESRNQKRGVYPYGSEQNFDAWLRSNVNALKAEYGQQAGESYKAEMLPFKEKIAAIRRNTGLSVQAQIALEEKLRKQQYDIYLKYDKNYLEELLKMAKNKNEAYALVNQSFWQELKKVRKTRLAELKKNKSQTINISNKSMMGLLLLGVVSFGTYGILKD
ncbi:hypothetical protein ACIRNY_11400 [Capnocytophaga canimorsus]|uniref:hypothetical protein n=1 Tax=Capnocytophaga canimorsus TaxID=28188 RepID=UPI0038507ECC